MDESGAVAAGRVDGAEVNLLRRAIEATRLLILLVDERGRVERVNRAVEALTGRPGEMLCKPIWELAENPAERARLEDHFSHVGDGPPSELLFHLISAAGPAPVVDWTVDVVDEPGQARHYVLTGMDVSKRLIANERLRGTDELRRLILDRLPAVVWMTDRDLRFTFGNGGGLTELGLSSDQLALLQTSLYGYFQTEDPNHPAIAAHLRALDGVSSSYQLTWSDRTYESRVEPIRDREQNIVGCIGIAFDITERTRTARALEDSQNRLRRLVEADVIGIVFWDSDGRVTDANESFLRLVGYTREELLSGAISWRDMTPVEYRHLDERAIAELMKTGRCTPFEKAYLSKSGQQVPVLVGGAVSGVRRDEQFSGVAFILDLREQIRLRAARDQLLAQEQAARLETEMANARLMLLVEGSKRIARTLTVAETLRALAEVIVPALADWTYIAHRGHDGEGWIVASAHGDPNQSELLRQLHDCRPDLEAPEGAPRAFRTGEARIYADIAPESLSPVERQWPVVGTRDPEHLRTIRELGMRSLLCVPIRGRVGVDAVAMMVSANDPRRYGAEDVLLAEDLASRAAVALENGRLLAEALEAIESRDNFLSVAAHELRTPLTSLLLQIEMGRRALVDNQVDQKAVLRGLSSSEVQARKLSALIDSLLDVARLRTGRLTIQPEELDIGQVVSETVGTMSPDAERAGCAIEVSVPGKIMGCWDRGRIEQVLRNLLSNAMKFGAGHPIEVRLAVAADVVQISVRDHGVGLAREDQTRIFGRFERAVSTRHFGGLGLGLYVSAQILRAHNGSLRVESEPGQGATFIVELPRGDGRIESGPPADELEKPPVPGP
jgi:PAS domain S-box-containing protein